MAYMHRNTAYFDGVYKCEEFFARQLYVAFAVRIARFADPQAISSSTKLLRFTRNSVPLPRRGRLLD